MIVKKTFRVGCICLNENKLCVSICFAISGCAKNQICLPILPVVKISFHVID